MYKLRLKKYKEKIEPRYVFTFFFENKYNEYTNELSIPSEFVKDEIIDEIMTLFNKVKGVSLDYYIYKSINNFDKYFTNGYSEYNEDLRFYKCQIGIDEFNNYVPLQDFQVHYIDDNGLKHVCEIYKD